MRPEFIPWTSAGPHIEQAINDDAVVKAIKDAFTKNSRLKNVAGSWSEFYGETFSAVLDRFATEATSSLVARVLTGSVLPAQDRPVGAGGRPALSLEDDWNIALNMDPRRTPEGVRCDSRVYVFLMRACVKEGSRVAQAKVRDLEKAKKTLRISESTSDATGSNEISLDTHEVKTETRPAGNQSKPSRGKKGPVELVYDITTFYLVFLRHATHDYDLYTPSELESTVAEIRSLGENWVRLLEDGILAHRMKCHSDAWNSIIDVPLSCIQCQFTPFFRQLEVDVFEYKPPKDRPDLDPVPPVHEALKIVEQWRQSEPYQFQLQAFRREHRALMIQLLNTPLFPGGSI